jgi:RNA polymerase sigma factor (sigma-70 family)
VGPTPQPGWDELEPHLRAARSGDPAARNALAALLRPVLLAWADRRFGPARGDMSASDVTHDALNDALGQLGTFRGKHDAASFWAWLDKILVNRISNWARRHAASKRPPAAGGVAVGGTDGIDPPAGGLSPSGNVAVAERNQRIALALDRLAPGDRDLVVGHYFDKKTHQELADAFNLSPGAVHERLKRARGELRDLLGGSS